MSAFLRAWHKTRRREGTALSNHVSDRGGKTKHGITERVARANGYAGQMYALTAPEAERIAKSQYWDVLNCDRIAQHSEPIAAEMFDTLFHGGEPGQWLQEALNLFNRRGADYPDMKVDGRIGPLTLDCLRAYLARRGNEGERVMVTVLNVFQGTRLAAIIQGNPTQEDFAFGWFLNRVCV